MVAWFAEFNYNIFISYRPIGNFLTSWVIGFVTRLRAALARIAPGKWAGYPLRVQGLALRDAHWLEHLAQPVRVTDFVQQAPGVDRPLRSRDDELPRFLGGLHHRPEGTRAYATKELGAPRDTAGASGSRGQSYFPSQQGSVLGISMSKPTPDECF